MSKTVIEILEIKKFLLLYQLSGGPGGRGWWYIFKKWTTNPVPLVHTPRLHTTLVHRLNWYLISYSS